jgi:hypothetical protein
MADDLLSRIPAWLKSLYEMENELRDAARNGLILRNEKASQHLAGGRRHLDEVMKQVRGEEPSDRRRHCAKRALMATREKCVHQSYRKGGRPKFTQPATQTRGTSAEQELGARPQGSGR